MNNQIDEKQEKGLPRWAWIGCVLFVIAAGLQSASESIGGGDTWVAMACGRYQLGEWPQGPTQQKNRTGQMRLLDKFGIHITQQEPLGARTRAFNPDNKKDTGWVNQNWLTHVLFYKMKTSLGENSIVVYKFIQAILTALFAYWAARVLGAHPLLAAGAAAFGILLSRSFVDLRPNVSSILFAAIMIMLLAYWKQGNFWALAGMFPVMLIWSNVHGGFIYAIMIFAIMVGAHLVQTYLKKGSYIFLLLGMLALVVLLFMGMPKLQKEMRNFQQHKQAGITTLNRAKAQKIDEKTIAEIENQIAGFSKQINAYRVWQAAGIIAAILALGIVIMSLVRYEQISGESFIHIGSRGFWFLLGGLAMVTLVPAIFSPFGLENLIHPMIIAVGKEGAQWREVIEWKPIWEVAGFGKEESYIVFLILMAAVFVAWWVLFFLKPQSPESRRRRQRMAVTSIPWPKIDLAQIAVMAITVIMSVKSRRFIFLGGVVLSPFLAVMAQEIINMIQIRRAYRQKQPLKIKPLPTQWAWAGVLVSLAATALLSMVFAWSIHKIYYTGDAKQMTMFRKMVGIADQPVEAMKFFDKIKPKGVVFNQWTHGGFVSFGQTPDPQTGEPPCKVFMDGRAQAAYTLEHYLHWRDISALPRNNPNKFIPALEQEDINVALLDIAKSFEAIKLLHESDKWALVYKDRNQKKNPRYYIFLRSDHPRNREALQRILELRREQRKARNPQSPSPTAQD